MITITTAAGTAGLKPGDVISFATPGRRWWHFWKPRTTYRLITAIATGSDDE